MTDTRLTFCSLCESFCGLEVDVQDNKITAIRPDKNHVVTQGYACVKGTHFDSVQHSPDRITEPQKRVGDTWHSIGWEQALSEIADKIKQIKQAHGAQSISHFVGAPGGANLLAPIFRGAVFKGLESNRMYGTGTCDTMNKFRVNGDLYGSPMRLAYPDVDHTEFMLVLGANPSVSGNTLYHLPRSRERFGDVIKRGGRVVFINPRRVESASNAEHVFIRPDTDVYFLAAFCNEVIRRNAVDEARISARMKNFESLKETVADWTGERQAAVTGISVEVFNDLVDHHYVSANAAALNMATGVNQGRSGTLCYWLLESISAISGNFGRKGGNLIGEGLIDFATQAKEDPQMNLGYHREDDLPTVSGQQPAGMVADDISSGRVRAMIVEASNPLLACGNPDGRLEQSMADLELLVSVDLFRNETGNLAHYILPATTWMERTGMPYALQSFVGCNATPYLYASGAVLEPPPGVRGEWWIYVRLADKLGITLMNNKLISGVLKLAARLAHTPLGFLKVPDLLINGMLKKAGQPGLKAMIKDHPHGILLPDNPGNNFLGTKKVLTPDGLVDLAPPPYVERFNDSIEAMYQEEVNNLGRIKLIGKREVKRMNSSSANSERLVKEVTNYAYMTVEDAARLGIAELEYVDVTSEHGSITLPAKVTDEMMLGTVAIPQCWGHKDADGLRHAQKHPGVNSNFLAGDGRDNIEKLSGMSHLSGILVDIKKSARIAASQ